MSADIEKVITLSPVEARAGVNLRLENHVEKKCPACRGEGEKLIRLSNTMQDTFECEDCEGFGVIDALETIEIKIESSNGSRDERKFVYEGLGNYSKTPNTRGDLIVRVKVDRISVENEERDFTILSYGELEDFDEKFEQEQDDFQRKNANDLQKDESNLKRQQFWIEDFEDDDENDDFVNEDEIEENSGEIYAPLMQMATPELYEKNAFRLLGILPGISEREAKRTVDKIQKLRNAHIPVDYSQTFLPIPEVDDEEIVKAGQIILNAEERFLHEFFWIFPASFSGEQENETFVSALQKNDLKTSVNIIGDEIFDYILASPHSVIGYQSKNDTYGLKLHNIAILCHMQAFNGSESWEHSYWCWERLYKNDAFWSFLKEQRVGEINNPLVRASTVQQIRTNLPRLILTINSKLAVRYAENGKNEQAVEQVELIRNEFDDEDLGLEILQEVAQPKKEQIEHLLDDFKFEIKKSKEDNNIIIKEFLGKTEKLINVLKVLLGDKDPSVINLGNRIIIQANNAAIDYGEETENWRECLVLFAFLFRFPRNSENEELLFKNRQNITDQVVKNEIKDLCTEAVEACDLDILQAPSIIKNFIEGSKNLIVSLGLDSAAAPNWADPIVHNANKLMIEYGNETGQWQECLAMQAKLLELPCSEWLKKQLADDELEITAQLHQKEITDLLDHAVESSKHVFPPVPVIVKDLLIKCRQVLDKKSKELGANSDVILELREIIYSVANGLLIKYVNEKEDFARTLEVLEILKPFAVNAENQKRLSDDIATLQQNEEFYRKTVRCWFCQENKGDEVSNIKVPMHGEVVKNRLFNRTEITWRNAEVTVPRCLSCDALHLRKSKFTTKGLVIGGLFGFLINLPIIFIYADYIQAEMLWLASFVIGGFFWLGYDISREANQATQPKQTNDLKTKYQHPLILELQQKGWSVGERPSA